MSSRQRYGAAGRAVVLLTVISGMALGSGCAAFSRAVERPPGNPQPSVAQQYVGGLATATSDPAAVHVGDNHDHDADLPETPEAIPVWDAEARRAAAHTAELAVATYAADLPPDGWWRALVTLLTPTAQTAYVATDPSTVPIGDITGPAAVPVETPSPYLVQVEVPTDAGPYGVLLVRAAAGEPWLVERFLPSVTEIPPA